MDQCSEVLAPPLLFDDPGANLERRTVADVPRVPAGELRNPIAVLVAVVTDDRTLHQSRLRRAHESEHERAAVVG